MDLTVCICTHERPAYLRACLEGLQHQTVGLDQFRVLVVDSASTGDTPGRIAEMVAQLGNARLLRIEQPGISVARNAAAIIACTGHIAFIDDDAIPAPDWIECILAAISGPAPPALIGGRILPRWEAPLPAWWPPRLRGILSIIEAEGQGEYRTADLPPGLEPYGANVVVDVEAMLAIGGFAAQCGRVGGQLLSDEEVQLAWRLQEAGYSACYNSRLVVHHQIQEARLTPRWLMSRQYWQGVSAVRTRRLLGWGGAIWRELPRRVAVVALLAPTGLLPQHSTRLLPCRWRLAYAAGFIRGALGPGSRAIG